MKRSMTCLLAAGLCLFDPGSVLADGVDAGKSVEQDVMPLFDEAVNRGDETAALEHLLEYVERTHGEN